MSPCEFLWAYFGKNTIFVQLFSDQPPIKHGNIHVVLTCVLVSKLSHFK